MNIGTLTIEMAANVARLSKDMDAARRTVERTFGSIEKDVARLKDMIGGLFAGVSATMFVGKLVAVQREFDVLNSSLKTVTGSAAAAERDMAWLKQFAKETPFGLAQATQGFVKMQALGLNPTRAALTSFGNTASAMGKDLNQMIEAVADASTGEFERLKEFGIKAKKEGDNVSLTFQGVTTNIGNNAAEITAYLQAIGDNQFAGAMAERAKTLDGAIAGLGDTWDELFRTINAQPAGGIIYDSVVLATNAIEDMITILNALNGATAENAKQTGEMKVLQDGMAIVFETVAVLGVNLKYVLVQIGNEIGGIAAQIAAVLRGDFAQAGAIRDMMVADAEAARKEVDAVTARILNARKEALAAQGVQQAVAAGAPAVARALGGSSDAAKKFADQLENLLNKINGKDAGVDADFYKNLELLRDGYNKGKLSLEEYMALAEKYIKQQKFYQDQVKESAAAEEERRKAVERAAEEYAKAIMSAEDMVDQIQFETRALQMTNVEREVAIRLRDLERKGIKAGSAEYEEYARRIREAIVGKETVEASLEQQRKATKEWEKTWDQVGQSLTDALMRGFEAGDGFGKNFVKSLQNTLKTTVLKIAVQAVVSPVSSGIGQMIGIPGAGDSSSIGGLLSTGSSLANLAGVGGSLGGFSAGYASMAAEMAAGSSFVGPSVAAANGALGAGAATASALGPIATAAPYIAAALVVANAVGLFGKRGGPQQGQYGEVGAGGYSSSFTMSGGDALGNQALSQSAYAQAAALYAMAGKKVADLTIQQGYKLDPQGSASGVAYRNILVGGKTLTGGTFDGNNGAQWTGSNSDAAGAANFLGKLNTAEIVALVKEIADPKLSAAAEALLANFGELEKSLPAWSIAQASQQALTQSLMTSEEKAAETSKNLKEKFDALGMSMPTSTSGLKSLVDGLDLTTQSGQDTLASLKDLVPAFVAFDQQTQATRDALEQQMDGVAKAIEAMGMTALEKSLSDISAATRAAIEQAAKLSATEEQLAKVRELGAKQAAALLGSEASKAYTGLLTASGKQIEAMQFQLAEAQAAYSTAVSALADDNKISIDQVNEYIQRAGSLDAAAKQYWGELGDAQDAQTQRKKQLLIEMVNAATAVDTLDKQLADARVAAQKELNDAQLAAQKEASRNAAEAEWLLAEARNRINEQAYALQGRLLQLQGDTIALRARELAETDEANRYILERIYAIEDERAATAAAIEQQKQRKDAAEKATNAAFAALERAIDAQRTSIMAMRDAAQEQVDSVTAVFDVLKSNIEDLYNEAASTSAMGAAAGQAFIAQALATARSTGYLPDSNELSQAIGAARGGLASGRYASAFEAERDRLVLAGRLSQLREISGNQLTTAEQQLKVAEQQLESLDGQLATARAQLDAMRGVDQRVLSVEQAIRELNVAMAAELRALGGALAASKAPSAAYSVEDTPAERQAKVEYQTGVRVDAADSPLVAAAKVLYQSIHGGASTAEYNAAAAAVGGNIGAALGWNGSTEDAERIRAQYGFAAGGLHDGGVRMVGENGPEIEVTGPARYYSAGQTAAMLGGGAEVANEVRQLREENQAQARAMVQLQARVTRLLERWDGDGMPETRSVTA